MKESEIRPKALFDRYLDLCRSDVDRFFSNHDGFADVPCTACGGTLHADGGFLKFGFRYEECADCHSLYVSPRPTPDMQEEFARESEATKFWSTHFYKETAEARREKMFRPRAEAVRRLVEDGILDRTKTFADVGAGYGIFLEEISRLSMFDRVVGIEPAPSLAAVCREKGFPVVEKMMESVEPGELDADLLTAFEVLEHVFDPRRFLSACANALHDRGVLLFTTLTISGFDLQILWDRSKSIYPPQHINLLSIEGIRRLAEKSGLEIISLTTPGKLDVDIIGNQWRDNPELVLPRFVCALLQAEAGVRDEFQNFLQRSNLSSHVRVLARKSR